MKHYAVIDTNVLVSALLTRNSESPVVKVVDAIRNNVIIPLFDETILAEYADVLHRKRFGFEESKIEELISTMKARGLNCERKPIEEIIPDPDDVVFYEVAMSKENAYLVTGNLKHFPKNGRVVSPADMAQIIEFGKIRRDILSEPDSSLYMYIPLSEIDAIITEYRQIYPQTWHGTDGEGAKNGVKRSLRRTFVTTKGKKEGRNVTEAVWVNSYFRPL